MCTLVVTQRPALFQEVSWPGFLCTLFWLSLSCFSWWVGLVINMHSSGDTDCSLSYFRGWVGLGFNVHSPGDKDYGLSCFRMWVGLVFNVHFLWYRLWPVLFQRVSWPGFQFALFWLYCGLSCFRRWVVLVFNVHSSSDTNWPVLFQEVSWPGFSMCTLLVTQMVASLVSASELAWFLLCSLLVTHILLLLS